MAVKSLIETVTVGAGGAASIEFLDIPQDGSDLMVVLSGRSSVSGSADCYLQINSQYGLGHTRLVGTGSSVFSSNANPIFRIPATSYAANTFGSTSIYIANYTQSGISKSVSLDAVVENNSTTAEWATLVSLSSANTSPVSQIAIGFSAQFAQHSSASLYKIKYD